jgi:uncharacterized protein (TIGR02246 family)
MQNDTPTPQVTSDESAVRSLIEHWAAAVRSMDYDGIVKHHSADILMFDVPPPLQGRGIDAYRKTWDVFFRWTGERVVYDILELNVTAGDTVAFATAIMQCSGTEPSGERVQLQFRLTVGLERVNGVWTITHEHHSIPATT